MTAEELLAKHGIKLPSTAPGRYYVCCPKCSRGRSKPHQENKVLGVTIEADGSVHFGCNHCDFRGPEKSSGKRPELQAYIYRDADGVPRFRKVRNLPHREPRFWLERADGPGRWLKGTKGVNTKILYRINEAMKAIAAGAVVACVEGEKDANNLWRIGIAATCNAHGASEPGKRPKWTNEHSEQLRGADVVVLNDNDPAGYEHADTTCKLSLGIAKRIRRLDLKPHWGSGEMPKGADVSDWLAAGHTGEELAALIAGTPDYAAPEQKQGPQEPKEETTNDISAEIERLARLSTVEYENQRKGAAEKLGVRASILDKLVAVDRANLGLDGDGRQGHAISFPEPEPWPEPVIGAELLDDLATAIRRHVVLADHVRDACTLWAAHTYLINCFLVSPRLAIRSAVKGCGKTTLLDVLEHLAAKPLRTSSVTASVTFRLIEAHQPSLLIDEADKILNEDRRDLLGILNDGHRRGGRSVRNVPVGDGYEPRAFATFSALAIALIGSPPAELYDRSVVIDLKRRLPAEAVEQLRIGRTAHLEVFPRKLARWAKDHADVVAAADPKMPDGIFNREADNWLPLLAIADAAGGEWRERARKAAQASHNVHTEGASRLELLLGDLRDVFGSKSEMPSADLVEDLVALDGHPWKEMGKSRKPLSQNGLARMLRPLGIAPDMTGPKTKRLSGYKLAQFKEAFERYLPSEGDCNLTPSHHAANTGTSDDSQPHTHKTGCEVEKCQKSNNDGLVRGCEVAKGSDSGEGHICAHCGRPGGNQVSFGDGCIWLHRACEVPWIDRRMGEEGIRQ
jgi:uncharacterized protein DUF3631